MKRCISFLLWVAAAAAISSAQGAGLIIVDSAHWLPEPHPPRPIPAPWPPHRLPPPRIYSFAPLEVNSVRAHVQITDQVARTTIAQEFHNPNPARVEGTFIFPVPKGAHLDKFAMTIDGKPMEAELLDADKGRRLYEDIVRKLRDPALLEYAGRDLFKVRVYPIEPNSNKHITLSYTELLTADNGLVDYVLPLDTGKFSASPIKKLGVKVDLTTTRPLKSIYSPTHSIEVTRHGARHATIGFEASAVKPNEDFALYYAAEKDEVGVNLIAHRAAGEDGYFLLLASPGMDVAREQVAAKDIAFVLDTSGSMAGPKLEQAKKALLFCIENLNESDRFEILRFSTEVEPLYQGLVSASEENRAKARAFVKGLKPIGGTAIHDALKSAVSLRHAASDRPFEIIFLTDGLPTIGVTDEDRIVEAVTSSEKNRPRIFCFGIGTDVNTHLLDRISEGTRAISQYVLPEEDIEVKVSSFFSKISDPALANPTIEFSGGVRAAKLYPSPLPDLFKGQQLVLVGRYSGHGDSALVLEGTVNSKKKRFAYDLKFPEEESENSFVPRLWATRRVGYLLDEIRLHGENAELRDEVAELARQYGIVTPYTAYLILEDESRRDVPATARSFGSFQSDSAAREEAARTWNEFKTKRAGESAVADAMSGAMLKSANAPTLAAQSSALSFERRYGLASARPAAPDVSAPNPAPAAPRQRLLDYSRTARFVAGKTFFQNGTDFVDSAVQSHPKASHVRIPFGSPEYFELVNRRREARPWLALGQNVQFVLDGKIYEIFATDPD